MAPRARDINRKTTKARRDTQQNKVLKHLLSRGTITPLEALGVYKISRLAARIEELRSKGVRIVSEMRADAEGSRYVCYRML